MTITPILYLLMARLQLLLDLLHLLGSSRLKEEPLQTHSLVKMLMVHGLLLYAMMPVGI